MGSWLSRYLASRRQKTEKACWTISSDSCRMSKMSVRTFSSSLKKLKVHFTYLYPLAFGLLNSVTNLVPFF